jgi:hypothetical protein
VSTFHAYAAAKPHSALQPFTFDPGELRPEEVEVMKCVFDSYTDYTAGKVPGADEIFDNFPAITGKKPRTLADFAKKHAARFRY